MKFNKFHKKFPLSLRKMFSLTAHNYTKSHGTQTMYANDVSSGAPIRSKLYNVHTLWSNTCSGHLSKKSKSKFKMQMKVPLLHCELVMCVGKTKVPLVFMVHFQKASKYKQRDPACLSFSGKKRKKKNTGPSRCIMFLHLSFYLYDVGGTQCYTNKSKTNKIMSSSRT